MNANPNSELSIATISLAQNLPKPAAIRTSTPPLALVVAGVSPSIRYNQSDAFARRRVSLHHQDASAGRRSRSASVTIEQSDIFTDSKIRRRGRSCDLDDQTATISRLATLNMSIQPS